MTRDEMEARLATVIADLDDKREHLLRSGVPKAVIPIVLGISLLGCPESSEVVLYGGPFGGNSGYTGGAGGTATNTGGAGGAVGGSGALGGSGGTGTGASGGPAGAGGA